MIFSLWFLPWVVTLTIGVPLLLLPALALCLRSSYLERPVLPGRTILIPVVSIFLFCIITQPVSTALGIAGRVCLVMLWLRHVSAVLNDSSPGVRLLPFRRLAHYYQITIRAWRGLTEIFEDTSYAAHVQHKILRRQKLPLPRGLLARLSIDWHYLVVVLSEVVSLTIGFNDAITARGYLPPAREWKNRPSFQRPFYVADAVVFLIIGLLLVPVARDITPSWLYDTANAIYHNARNIAQQGP